MLTFKRGKTGIDERL